MLSYLTKESWKVRELKEVKMPRCKGSCYFVIVHIEKNYAEWRCAKCRNYTSVDIPAAGQASLF